MAETPAPVLAYNRVDANHRNTRLLFAAFVLLTLPLAWGIAQYLGPVLTVYQGGFNPEHPFQSNPAAEMVAVFMVLLAVILATALMYLASMFSSGFLLWRTDATRIGPEEQPELRHLVENLCIGAGLPVPALYMMQSTTPNAFATGYDPEHAKLIVTRGLLELLDPRELSAVIAHELSHIGNHDTDLNTTLAALVAAVRLPTSALFGLTNVVYSLGPVGALIAAVVFGASVLYLMLVYAMSGWELIFSPDAHPFALSVRTAAAMLVPPYVFLFAPAIALFLRNRISHQREFLADGDAVLLTRDPEGLALALAKASAAAGAPVHTGDEATAHMFFLDPMPARGWGWGTVLPAHPSVDARIAMLTRMGDGFVEHLAAAADAGVDYRGRALLEQFAPIPLVVSGSFLSKNAINNEPGQRLRLVDPRTRLYRSPDGQSAVIAEIDAGTAVTALGIENGFYRVRTDDGTPGYIDVAAHTHSCSPEWNAQSIGGIHHEPDPGPVFTEWKALGSQFRLTDHVTPLYSKPDGWSPVVQQLPAGCVVTLVGLEGNFARVRSEQTDGYISRTAAGQELTAQLT